MVRKKQNPQDHRSIHNIIIFGESGAGKSSVVNMIAGVEVAKTDGEAAGATFKYTRYPLDIDGFQFNVYDTAGLNEGDQGTVRKEAAIAQLYELLIGLSSGVSLLMFCMRAPRIKDSYAKNYRLFHELVCSKKVPITIVVTGLENEDRMDDWWSRNKHTFDRHEMIFKGHACVTATRGKQRDDGTYRYDTEYAESQRKVRKVIKDRMLQVPWVVPQKQWVHEVVKACWRVKILNEEEVTRMASICKMEENEAKELVKRLKKVKQKKL